LHSFAAAEYEVILIEALNSNVFLSKIENSWGKKIMTGLMCTVMKHRVTTQGVVVLDGGKEILQS
jgi:hypothetical protein